MFVTQQTQQLISDVDYRDPSQVEVLRQQLAHQYENFCYGSKRISVSQQKKYNKQAATINAHKKITSPNREQQKRIIGKDIQNSIQNEKIRQAISQPIDNTPVKDDDHYNLYKIEVPKTSQKKRKQNLSPSLLGSQTIPVEMIKEGLTQKQYENSVYLSPLIQNCLEEEIITQEQQRYSSAPSRKYLEMYDYSKDKLQKMYGMTGNFEMSKLYERTSSPEKNLSQMSQPLYYTQEKNLSQASQLYHIEIENDKDVQRNNTSQLNTSNKSSIHYTSQGQISQQQSLTAPPKSSQNTQRNKNNDHDKTKFIPSKNSQEDLVDIKKKIDFAESFDIGKGRNSMQVMKPNNISSYSSKTYWSVSKKRNSTGLINQIQSTKLSNEGDFQFTADQRHTHQLIKNSGIYLRNKPEYLSDPRYKLIENLNKVSQTVNIKNINNHSVRQGQKKVAEMSRIIPYCHNFVESYKESFYHPQTSYENKYKIYNPRKSQELSQLPHQAFSRISQTTPRGSMTREQSPSDDKIPHVTPFNQKDYIEEDTIYIKYPKKIISQASKATQEDEQDDGEEFQYYQGSMNRYNCLYLNRNQRVRLSRNSSPNRKKNNLLNQSVDSSIATKKNSIQFEDPRKEYRDKQKKLEDMLNVASTKKHVQQDNLVSERYTPNQESVYLKKSRNYGTPYRNSNNNTTVNQPSSSQLSDYTLNAFVFKNQSNSSQK